MPHNKGFAVIELLIAIVVIGVIGLATYVVLRPIIDPSLNIIDPGFSSNNTNIPISNAVQEGKQLSYNSCDGEGSVTLTHSPMNYDDYAYIIPYGLMIGSHVTPIDHGYFEPTDRSLPRDTYPVFAMADGAIVDIQDRARNSDSDDPFVEYRLVFTHTCTFFTYYDLVTRLTPKIAAEFEEYRNGNYAKTSVDVKAGEQIGWIGGQTLDYAVWDTTKQLDGFLSPKLYDSEAWKIFTANPFDYMTDELETELMSKNLRYTEPLSGKIDHDVDGTLQGNWFKYGTNGYAGSDFLDNYWDGHLSFSPDHIDPTAFIFSSGNFGGKTQQALITRSAINPINVTPETDAVKYPLYTYSYDDSNEDFWNGSQFVTNLTMVQNQEMVGCVWVKMIDNRTLHVDTFPDTSCNEVNDFTNTMTVYTR